MSDLDVKIPADVYAAIESMIRSEQSPVGIDAKHTHVIIIHKLIEIEKRLTALEAARKA